MGSAIRADDEIRLNILEALLKKRSVVPNIRQIKAYTSYHKATIKSSLDFLAKKGILSGFGPKFNFKGLGQSLEVITLFEADLSNKRAVNRIISTMQKDPNLYRLSSIIGSGNWNIIGHYIYKDIESYHAGINKKYYGEIPSMYRVMKNRQIFYLTEPVYKNVSRTKSVVDIIRNERGLSASKD